MLIVLSDITGVPCGLPEVIEPSTVLPETVDDSAGAEIAPRETDPSTILPLTLLFEITDEWLLTSPFTMLFDIIDEVTEISALMMLSSIFMGLLLEIEVWLMTAFSIKQPDCVCSFQPLLTDVNMTEPSLKYILSLSVPLAINVPFT